MEKVTAFKSDDEYFDVFVPYNKNEPITKTSLSEEEYIKHTKFAQKPTKEDIEDLMVKRYGSHFTKDPKDYNKDRLKLKINKRLPKIKLPASKLEMFADWWNKDIRFEKSIPHTFEEGYLIIDNEHKQTVDNYKELIKETAKMYKTTYRNIEHQLQEFLDVMRNITIHFKFIKENAMYTELYDGDNLRFATVDFAVGENSDPEPEILLYKKMIQPGFKTDPITLDNVINKFSYHYIYFLVTCLWYMATTAPSARYIYEEKTPVIESRHKRVVHVSDTKFIVSQVYDLKKIRTVKVERLVTRKKGWTYSHSFQVHGHYRHYKDGKIIFIESYIKGKGKPFKAQTTILAPEKIKEE